MANRSPWAVVFWRGSWDLASRLRLLDGEDLEMLLIGAQVGGMRARDGLESEETSHRSVMSARPQRVRRLVVVVGTRGGDEGASANQRGGERLKEPKDEEGGFGARLSRVEEDRQSIVEGSESSSAGAQRLRADVCGQIVVSSWGCERDENTLNGESNPATQHAGDVGTDKKEGEGGHEVLWAILKSRRVNNDNDRVQHPMPHAPIPVPISLRPSISVNTRPVVSHLGRVWDTSTKDTRLKKCSVIERNESRRRKMVVICMKRLFVWLQLSAIFDPLLHQEKVCGKLLVG
ncbi:hypothetical protein B0H13DRAFT_1929100 [Mycena leptocephala]|nr:hypothetical protein B0H13DRAFT_1929100 [Mycena leptocephala]